MWSLVLLKPDLVAHPVILKAALTELISGGIEIGGCRRLRLSREAAEQLYGSHEGKFFYPRLVRHVTSGPVVALRVRGDVRSLLGGSKLWPLASDQPPTMRQRLSLTDVRNVAHASDPEAAERELGIFEPLTGGNEFLRDLME